MNVMQERKQNPIWFRAQVELLAGDSSRLHVYLPSSDNIPAITLKLEAYEEGLWSKPAFALTLPLIPASTEANLLHLATEHFIMKGLKKWYLKIRLIQGLRQGSLWLSCTHPGTAKFPPIVTPRELTDDRLWHGWLIAGNLYKILDEGGVGLQLEKLKIDEEPALPLNIFVLPQKQRPPTVERLDAIKNADSIPVPKALGLYRLHSATRPSVTLPVVDANFPACTTDEQRLGPLRYFLTEGQSKSWQKSLVNGKSESLSAFWAEQGHKNPAQEAGFYRRVELANLLFTVFREGWKTDRGMVLIAFGEPDVRTIVPGEERWYYDVKPGQVQPLEFVFDELANTPVVGEYHLRRVEEYTPYWNWAEGNFLKGNLR
jgi:GWxTD domain-containing protein